MARARYVFRITGKTPLLQHSTRGMMEPPRPEGKPKPKYDPKEEAELGTYPVDGDKFGHKAIAFYSALLKACTGRKVGKVSAKTKMKNSVFLLVDQLHVILEDPETGKPLKKSDYIVDVRPVVIQKNRVLRGRPRWDKWACTLYFEIDIDFLPEEQFDILIDLLNIAGDGIGVGDYRPERGGIYGRFKAELIEEVKEKKAG